jgi:predicted AlkP superfamily pyrophosphatase or phosphodiesterase
MKRTAVINVVGLTDALIGEHTPRIRDFAGRGSKASIKPVLPAVTCAAQSTYLTGLTPAEHGIVGNGWYNRDLAEVQFWKQSNHLVGGRKLWDELRERDSKFTCAKLFWWYNMYSTADFTITPRPMYPADGRKIFDIYTNPGDIRAKIKKDLGEFPFATFWGPAAGKNSPQGPPDAVSRWIAESAKWIEYQNQPTLSLIYLPHLDYNLQRYGPYTDSGTINPAIIPDLRAIDAIVGDLIRFFHERAVQVVLLSEYGITNVGRPIHLNRFFREHAGSWLAVREELGLELLDPGASGVFAVADHQVAHIYFNNRGLEKDMRTLIEREIGATVLGAEEKAKLGLDHPRAGDLIAIAPEDAWFTYYYWLDDHVAPDFARTVDIHRKPGYDPVELFVDPKIRSPKLKIALRLLQKKLGFRMLMDVVSLDATLVKGSHGRCPENVHDWPVLIAEQPELLHADRIEATDVYHLLKRCVLVNPD